MAGVVRAHRVLLWRRKRHERRLSQNVGALLFTEGRMKSPYPLICWLLSMTLLRTAHIWFETTDWLDQFCPLLTNLKHAIPVDAAEPKDRYSSFKFSRTFRCLEASNMLLSVFISLSLGLFIAAFLTIAVDGFNVPVLGVQTQEGSWNVAVDVFEKGKINK